MVELSKDFKKYPTMLHDLLELDLATGQLTWKTRESKWFSPKKGSPESAALVWNKQWAGKRAFTASNQNYYHGQLFSHGVRAHQVIYAMVNGVWPTLQIDHINGNRGDNRPENLREVTNSENARNRKKVTNNTSGFCGVTYRKSRKKWEASIYTASRVRLFLGNFDSVEDAVKVRKCAEIQHGYSLGHGQ